MPSAQRSVGVFAATFVLAAPLLAFAQDAFIPDYRGHDPLYTDEFDRLKACAARTALTYRYDYERVEVSASEQVAALLRQRCGAEIAALAALVSPLEKFGGPHEMTGALDDEITKPFFRPDNDWGAPRDHGAAKAGDSVVRGLERITYFASALPFRPGELAAVTREDAFAAYLPELDISPTVEYFGRIDGATYSYQTGVNAWQGRVTQDGITASVNCHWPDDYPPPPAAYRTCTLKMSNRLIRLTLRGDDFGASSLCNPGGFDSGIATPWRPPPNFSVKQPRRPASLVIDGEAPIALPEAGRGTFDAGDCTRVRDARSLLQRIAAAARIETTFIPLDDRRTVTVEGSGSLIGHAIELARHLFPRTYDAALRERVRADRLTLSLRAKPSTLEDMLRGEEAWAAAVRCAVRVARRRGLAAAAAIDDAACADALADLDSLATGGDLVRPFAADQTPPKPELRPIARAALAAEVAAQLAAGERGEASRQFTGDEIAQRVMGHAGFAVSGTNAKGQVPESYGYAIEGARAWGAVPGRAFNVSAKVPTGTVTIACVRAADQPARCTIRIPTGGGAFVMTTNGPWHSARTCLELPGRNLAGWQLIDSSGPKKAPVVLDKDGCEPRGTYRLTRAMSISGSGIDLLKPGAGEHDEERELLSSEFWSVAVSVAQYLAERLEE